MLHQRGIMFHHVGCANERRKSLRRHAVRLGFGMTTDSTNGAPRDAIVATRYVAGELAPSYALTRHLSVGAYYLYSYKIESGVKHTHFIASRANLTNVRISDRYLVQVALQLYYLKTDGDGVYFNSALTLAHRKLPLSISAMVNQAMRTNIPAAERFLWNVSLVYWIR